MKDIEKIKSEDLAAQVQDANPANFAIEQEVAQLVGATVPAPTEPSADDARELGAQLLVFLRRALTPIQTALRIALADIYAHLDSRCTAYTPAAYASYIPRPYDPMTTPRSPRTLPNILQALTAFAPRKISNGSAPNDGIPDGVSLAHILGETTAANAVVKIYDDNYGWTLNGTFAKFFNLFPNLTGLHLKCKQILFAADTGGVNASHSFSDWSLDEVETIINSGANYNGECFKSAGRENLSLPKLKKYQTYSYGKFLISDDVVKYANFPSLEMLAIYHSATWFADCPELLEVDFSGLQDFTSNGNTTFASNCPKLWCVKIGKTTGHLTQSLSITQNINFANCENLIRLEFTDGLNVSTNISTWSPTLDSSNLQQFLQNFREHIALRLTANGTGLTLTLSQAVRNAIHAAESTYGIENIIVTQKGWTISPAPGASSQ